jgi:ABC-type phosphate/phosphonate transport system permease subunit
MEAGLDAARFWLTLLSGFAVAFPFAFLANRSLIARGKGHAVVHEYHAH